MCLNSDTAASSASESAAHNLAVHQEIAEGLARDLDWLDVDEYRANISGGTLACLWHQSLLLLPSMVASLPPIERLIISGNLRRACRPPAIPPLLQRTMSAAPWLRAALCTISREMLPCVVIYFVKRDILPRRCYVAAHAAHVGMLAHGTPLPIMAATFALLGKALPLLPDVRAPLVYPEHHLPNQCMLVCPAWLCFDQGDGWSRGCPARRLPQTAASQCC